jgi:Probable Zinc-ribbon domain
MVDEWSAKNNSNPEEHLSSSHVKVYWECKEGHEWFAALRNRSQRKQGCPVCSGNKIAIGFNDFGSLHPLIAEEWSERNLLTPHDYTAGSEQKTAWKCDKNHEWESTINNRVSKLSNCPVCTRNIFVSQAEKTIRDYVESLGLTVSSNDRKTIGSEIDIYIPEKKIGIEFNGVYWHSEANGKGKNFHYDKWLSAADTGIQLLQIWEDDWNHNPMLIKRLLAHKLGVSQQEKVGARETEVVNLKAAEARLFMNQNHIQGFASGSYYLGLKHKKNKTIVAMLILKKEPKNILNIIRYATNANVQGGFSKLLKYSSTTYNPQAYITFADHAISDGGLYEKTGFTAVSEIAPDYSYLVRNVRKHKFGYRLKSFRNNPDLLWEEGLTESQLAALNNLSRIWDSGKTKYYMAVPASPTS